jgi:amidase
MPVLPWVGYKPKTWVRSKQWLGYTAMWNLLDYAGVTVPVTRADRGLDSVGGGLNAEWEGHSIRNESDAFNYLQCECFLVIFWIYTWLYANRGSLADDIDLVHGMPICVQIVGGRFGEEKAVAVGKVVDELMNPIPFHS